MDHHIKDFFRQSSDESPRGNFHKVIALQDAPDVDWQTITKIVPNLCRGWFELAHLPSRDRIEFSRDYWLNKLPYRQGFSEFIVRFFEQMDDVGVYITQQKFDDPYETCMIYSIKGDCGFFRGGVPATEDKLLNLQSRFPDYILPADYKAFLMIHNGFWKTTDCTGIAGTDCFSELMKRFKGYTAQQDQLSTTTGKGVNPGALIPFYESFGMPFFQCFWGEWYPEEEMGNVYYSAESKNIFFSESGEPCIENMAFATFLDWLMFYLESVQ